jgi:hypothetical protein
LAAAIADFSAGTTDFGHQRFSAQALWVAG